MNADQGIFDNSCDIIDESSKASEGATKLRLSATEKVMKTPSTRKREQISHQQIEITKNLFVVVCAFLACFVLYFVLIFLLEQSQAKIYIATLPFANSAMNFAIYACKHPNFKAVLRCMMRFSYTDIPQPSRLSKFLLSKKT